VRRLRPAVPPELRTGATVEFVSRSDIVVPISEMGALEHAFRDRARLVDRHVGYRGLELLRSIREDGRYVLLTRWRSQDDFRAYMKSGDHQRAHERSHVGLGPLGGGGKLEQLFSVILERADESAEL
jgi:heme-degrading monooxygenase HmoA